MTSKPLILIPVSKPPTTYLSALDTVGLSYVTDFSPPNLEDFSGLLLTGGGDILSCFYNEQTPCKNVNIIRDVNEMKIFKCFFSKNIPVLGICRGLQIINVCLGGTLRTVKNHQSACGKDIFHEILPSDGLFKTLQFSNSNHAQCIDRLCPLAQNVIFSKDKNIEGFTVKNTLAFQFHPERMDLSVTNLIFGEFANRVHAYFKSSR